MLCQLLFPSEHFNRIRHGTNWATLTKPLQMIASKQPAKVGHPHPKRPLGTSGSSQAPERSLSFVDLTLQDAGESGGRAGRRANRQGGPPPAAGNAACFSSVLFLGFNSEFWEVQWPLRQELFRQSDLRQRLFLRKRQWI